MEKRKSKVLGISLPYTIIFHLKVLSGAFFITVFFGLIWSGKLFAEGFWISFPLVAIQLELFMVIGTKLFRVGTGKGSPNYKFKIISRLFLFYLIVLLVAFIFLFFTISINVAVKGADFSETVNYMMTQGLKPFLISWIMGVGVASIAFFYLEWNNALAREQKLREEKLIFQYETLKSQVNPHFLFNSLNTLASLVNQNMELAEQFISRFSSVYRYILENRDKEWVSLKEEIEFVRNFFFLQQIRDESKIRLIVNVDAPDNYNILPISAQLLIENALKHNIATQEKPLVISLYIEDETMLVVENNLQTKMQIEPSSRTGLKNLCERISLTMERDVVVNKSAEKFIVKLPIAKVSNASIDHRR